MLFTPPIFPQFSIKYIEYACQFYVYAFFTTNPLSSNEEKQDIWIYNRAYLEKQPYQKQASALRTEYKDMMPLDMMYRDKETSKVHYRGTNRQLREDDPTVKSLLRSWLRHDELQDKVKMQGKNNIQLIQGPKLGQINYTILEEYPPKEMYDLVTKYGVDEL